MKVHWCGIFVCKLMNNIRKMTFEESGKTIMPYTSLSSNFKKCKEHEWEIKKDFMGHIWSECKTCGSSK